MPSLVPDWPGRQQINRFWPYGSRWATWPVTTCPLSRLAAACPGTPLRTASRMVSQGMSILDAVRKGMPPQPAAGRENGQVVSGQVAQREP